VPPAPNTIVRASEHVCWFTPDGRTDRPALAVVRGSHSALQLEVGASADQLAGFHAAVADLDLPPLLGAVLTHWHWDHSFAGQHLRVPIIGHALSHGALLHQASLDWSDGALAARVAEGTEIAFCADMIRLEIPDRTGLAIVPPQIVISDGVDVDLGGVTCQIRHVGGDHADDSLVVHVVEDGLLFLGDCLYERLYAPVHHLTPRLLAPLVAAIAGFGATTAITGHHEDLLDGDALAAELAALRTGLALVDRLGSDALAAAPDERVAEVVGFLLAG
jgi:glyoxylase-like metal-dependent hydrolase (beta-lactamase superfamily II)